MPGDEAEQAHIYACPHCDETFPCGTPDERVQITLHRALHARNRSERRGHQRLIMDSDERTKPVS